MTKEIWINLPVKDLAKAKAFFTAIGFSFNTKYGNTEVSAALQVGKNIIMLFTEEMFKTVSGNQPSNTRQGSEMLISFDVDSREEVDAVASKAANGGGNVFGKPSEIQGWMYGCGFSDLDGHRWNALYMDMSQMPKGQSTEV